MTDSDKRGLHQSEKEESLSLPQIRSRDSVSTNNTVGREEERKRRKGFRKGSGAEAEHCLAEFRMKSYVALIIEELALSTET